MAENKGLLTEIDDLLTRLGKKYDGASHPKLLVEVHRNEVLARIREVVEGVKNPYEQPPYGKYITTYHDNAESMRQAILKVLGKAD